VKKSALAYMWGSEKREKKKFQIFEILKKKSGEIFWNPI
jgi:hypothetical protein